ncbi:MAG: M48 family metallopeptidase [Candidatus Micrarchaeia archaeon]
MYKPALEAIEEEEIEINNNKYKIIKAFSKISSARATIDNDSILIRFPYYYNSKQINDAYSNLKRRVIKMLEKHPEYLKKDKFDFSNEKFYNIIGRKIFIKKLDIENGKPSVTYFNDTILLKIPKDMLEQEKDKYTMLLLKKIVTKVFKEDLKKRIGEFNNKYFNSEINKVIIRDNSSNWGTYNRKTKNIGINFKLLFAPLPILDSVIVHELTHTKVLNHQKAFWDIVYEIIPDYKERRRWLIHNKYNIFNGEAEYQES